MKKQVMNSSFLQRSLSRLLVCLGTLMVGQNTLAAGFAPLNIPATENGPALSAMVWSPCAATPSGVELGPYQVQAVPQCTIVGKQLPLVVISHGSGGTLLGHYDTAIALADAGFVVVSLNHPGNTFGDDGAVGQIKIFESRPRDVSRVISFMTERWQHRQQLDAKAIGVFGFSRGGYTVLALAGAIPKNAASAKRLCGQADEASGPLCQRFKANDITLRPQADPRIRAGVVVDPLNLFDTGASLQAVRIPIQLWASELGGDGVELAHVEAIKTALPQAPEYHLARGAGHFAFLVPCSAALTKNAPSICVDAAGFDRSAYHQKMNADVVAFFQKKLR